jgi:membrane protease YdiL (CAAX protease family)
VSTVRTIRRETPGAALVVLGGATLLLARPFVPAGPTGRLWLFAAAYLTIGLASLAIRSPAAPTGPLPPEVVLLVGVAGLGAAGLAAGPAVPAAWGPGAAPLAILAALAEEALFRRAAYARLARFGPAVAVAATAVAFALVHLPAYGAAALPVDLGAGLLLSWQRWASGTWLVPATTHATANLLVVLA